MVMYRQEFERFKRLVTLYRKNLPNTALLEVIDILIQEYDLLLEENAELYNKLPDD